MIDADMGIGYQIVVWAAQFIVVLALFYTIGKALVSLWTRF